MPSIIIVFVIAFSSCTCVTVSGDGTVCCISDKARAVRSACCLIFLSCFESLISTRFSLRAFITTQKLDRLMAAAPIIGLSFSPNAG